MITAAFDVGPIQYLMVVPIAAIVAGVTLPRVFRVLGVVVIAGISRRFLIAIAVAVIATPTATAAAGTSANYTAIAAGTAANYTATAIFH